MLITEAIKFKKRAFLSLVGAGGKSSFLNIIVREFLDKKKKIILTTTTKMFTNQIIPLLNKGKVIETSDFIEMEERIREYFQLENNRLAILLSHRFREGESEKFTGPESFCLDRYWRKELSEIIVVEADGAKGRPIKAPSQNEPVIPNMVTEVIAVIGIDSIGLILDENNVFRSHIFSDLTGLEIGQRVDIDALLVLIKHPLGLFKDAPAGAEKHIFLNKVCDKGRAIIAEEIAYRIFQENIIKIKNIMIGDTLKKDNPITKVIKEKTI